MSSKWAGFLIRVSPSHSYAAGKAIWLMGCVRCMQWLCCVFGIDTGLKFREVASKGPFDVLIRELCKMTGVLWILSRAHALVLSLSDSLSLCVRCI